MKFFKLFILVIVVILFVFNAVAADKVVVIPLNTSSNTTDKLWGKGRPGTTLRTHLTSNGYCTTSSGINFALSLHYASWYDAQEVCPSGKWVCRLSDLPPAGACDIEPTFTSIRISCDGFYSTLVNLTILNGYVADAFTSIIPAYYGYTVDSNILNIPVGVKACEMRPVWCCWK